MSKQVLIETIQRKSARSIVNGKYNAHTDPLFKKLKILKIKDMVDQGRENKIKKIIQSKSSNSKTKIILF